MHNMRETFAVLKPDLGVDTVQAGPELYESLDRDYDAFKGHVLVAEHEFTDSWPTWERHPAGDEIVVLLSGRATMKLKLATGTDAVELREPGDYIVVPRNTWHTAMVTGRATMLFVTPGEGTENLENP